LRRHATFNLRSRSSHDGENACLHKQLPYGDCVRAIDLQQLNRCAASIGNAAKPGPLPHEVFPPDVPARIEQRHDFAVVRIDARHIRTFVTVAVTTGEREIVQRGGAAMLLGNDVIEMKRQFGKRFRKVTIFAAAPRTIPDGLLGRLVHHVF
jgi:hypothetical protein